MASNFFSHYLMPLAIGYIMFGVGLNLKFQDFKLTFRRPKAVITGLVAQMVVLPVIAFGINYFFDIDPILKVGLVLIAACPGGTTSNLVTLFLQGRLALSVALTAFNSFLIVFTIPIITNIALFVYVGHETNISLPVFQTIWNIFLTVLVPTMGGMLMKHYFPLTTARFEKTINISMTVFLLLVFTGVFLFEGTGTDNLWDYTFMFFPAFLLNVISMFAGYLISLTVGVRNRGRFTIAIQVGLQNSALAIYVASKLLGQVEMAYVAIIYGSFTLITTSFWAYIMKKYM